MEIILVIGMRLVISRKCKSNSGHTYAFPHSMNDAGVMVGKGYEAAPTNRHALVWLDPYSAPLVLDGLMPEGYADPDSINNNNVIVVLRI